MPSELATLAVGLIGWSGVIIAGFYVGKHKGREGAGIALTILLGLVGLLILACLPQTEAAKIEAAQREYQMRAEAARRAGYLYPPEQPYQPYPPGQSPYPQQPPGQWPYPQQPSPGQWQPSGQWQPPPPPGTWEQQPPPPGTWEQPPPTTWPGQQQ
jgi:hypothetical protein